MNDTFGFINLGPATFEDLIRSIDAKVKDLVEGDCKECVWTGVQALMPNILPPGFVEEWAHKGTWALNTVASQPKITNLAPKPSLSPLELAQLQHSVRSSLFDAMAKIAAAQSAVEIIESVRIRFEHGQLTVVVSVMTFIVARKMWHLYPQANKPAVSNAEHYSFGEAVAELLTTPEFEGITFKTDPTDETRDVELTRQDVADIFREQQAKTHQDIIRKDTGFNLFQVISGLQKKSPPFREGLLSLITDMREPNTTAIASWLQQIKKSFSTRTTQPLFLHQDNVADLINAQAPSNDLSDHQQV